MSFDQEKPERVAPLWSKETSPLNEPVQSIGHLAHTDSDSLPPQAGLACGQHPTSGTMPIVAPADCVSPVVREVQL